MTSHLRFLLLYLHLHVRALMIAVRGVDWNRILDGERQEGALGKHSLEGVQLNGSTHDDRKQRI